MKDMSIGTGRRRYGRWCARTTNASARTARQGGARHCYRGCCGAGAAAASSLFSTPARPTTRHGTRVRMDSSTVSFAASPLAAFAWMMWWRRRCLLSSGRLLQAAQAAEIQASARRDEVREALLRDLQAARYAADRAFRQYDAADPENRFIAGELEARWNRALGQTAAIERRIAEHDAAAPLRRPTTPISFADLAKDLGAVWSAPTTDARLKKRIVRTASCLGVGTDRR